MIEVYHAGSPVTILAWFEEYDPHVGYDYIDPDTTRTVTVTAPDGTTVVVNAETMLKAGALTGHYYYVWQSLVGSQIGRYKYTIAITHAGVSDTKRKTWTFELIAA
jgi:hypothetical protein